MLRVGLTGGIGSGKSTVAGVFEVLGVPVYYADSAGRMLVDNDPGIRTEIIKHFGKESYKDGRLDRQYISTIVFGDEKKRELLNEITHPVIISDAAKWMKKQNAAYIIKEAALIFESGSEKDLDYVIGVKSPRGLRVKRVMERDSTSKAEVIKKMESQMDEDVKMKKCDFLLINDEQQLLVPQVMALHQQLLQLAKGK